jgi:hypothetical protein
MTSKERVRAVLEHRPADKVPLGLYVIDHDTIGAVIGRPSIVRNWALYYPALWEGRRDEAVDRWKQDVRDLYRKLDCVDLLSFKDAPVVPPRGDRPADPPRPIGENLYGDSKGNVFQLAPESNTIKQVRFAPGTDAQAEYTVAQYADRTPPAAPDRSCFELMDFLIAEFGRDRYIAGGTGGITCVAFLGGMEEGLIRLASEPEVIHAHNEQSVFRQNLLDAWHIRPGVDGVLMEQDFSGTNGPLISPALFRELAYPYLKRRIQNVKQRVPHVLFHSCGNTMPLLDMLLDAGIDAYESIQTNAREISIDALTERSGARLCVWGNVSLEALNQGTPDDARRDVRRCLEAGRRAGGFILGPSHSIAFGTKYENFMAMLDEFATLR